MYVSQSLVPWLEQNKNRCFHKYNQIYVSYALHSHKNDYTVFEQAHTSQHDGKLGHIVRVRLGVGQYRMTTEREQVHRTGADITYSVYGAILRRSAAK